LSRHLIEVNPIGDGQRGEVKAYSAERKEAVLRRMMPPENKAVSALAGEAGITEQTLYTWRRQLKNQGMPAPGDGENPAG